MRHFVVHLEDGNIMDFNERCDEVGFFGNSDKIFVFKDSRTVRSPLLAIIPVDKVVRIVGEDDSV